MCLCRAETRGNTEVYIWNRTYQMVSSNKCINITNKITNNNYQYREEERSLILEGLCTPKYYNFTKPSTKNLWPYPEI